MDTIHYEMRDRMPMAFSAIIIRMMVAISAPTNLTEIHTKLKRRRLFMMNLQDRLFKNIDKNLIIK